MSSKRRYAYNFYSPGCSKYGADMGRAPLCTEDKFWPEEFPVIAEKLRLVRVPLNSGGYDPGGACWGIGEPLWHAVTPDGRWTYFRARDRKEARAKFPKAKFYR